MQNRTLDVAFACFIAATIGGLLTLAISVQFGFGWLPIPLGIALSGVSAYLAHDLPQLKEGFARAWHETIQWRPHWNWKRTRVRFTKNALLALLFCQIYFMGLTIALFAGLYMIAHRGFFEQKEPSLPELVLVMSTFCSGAVLIGLLVTEPARCSRHPQFRRHLRMSVRHGWHCMCYVNPVSLPVVVVCWLARILFWLISRLPKATRVLCTALWSFTKTAILYIHTEERRIRMTSTMLGVAIGSTWGYQHGLILPGALLCGALGALFGAIEYQLVSVKLLKLVPTRN